MNVPSTIPGQVSSVAESRSTRRARDGKSAVVGTSHMVQLDSLRAIAVFTVMASHYAPNYTHFFSWGYAAVFLFFVLSGFLITGILLRAREKDEIDGTSKFSSLRRFYLRRTLRIFPLYYAIVIICMFLLPSVRETWAWHMLYSVNFQMALTGEWIGLTAPFWSLGVEEQFYLVWPVIVLFLPIRWLYPLLITCIVAAPLSRFACIYAGFNAFALEYLPSSCLDALGLGSLLAFSRHPDLDKHGSSRYLGVGGLVGAVSLVVLLLLTRGTESARALLNILAPLSLSLIFVWVVSKCAIGVGGVVGTMLKFGPLVYLGKISYGLYALHYFAPNVVMGICEDLSIETSDLGIALSAIALTVSAGSLSWFLFERPINNLKDKFSADAGVLASPANLPETA